MNGRCRSRVMAGGQPLFLLLIHGTEDPIPVEMASELDARIENSRLVTVENVSHFPYIETPQRTIAAIRQFMADHERAAGRLGNGNGDYVH